MRLAIKPRSLLNVGRGVVRPWAGPPVCVLRTGRRLAGPLGPNPGSAPTARRGRARFALKRLVLLSGARKSFRGGGEGGFRASCRRAQAGENRRLSPEHADGASPGDCKDWNLVVRFYYHMVIGNPTRSSDYDQKRDRTTAYPNSL